MGLKLKVQRSSDPKDGFLTVEELRKDPFVSIKHPTEDRYLTIQEKCDALHIPLPFAEQVKAAMAAPDTKKGK